MRSRRPRTSLVLVGLGVVLLVAIAVGEQIGDRAIFSATQHRLAFPDDTITPVPEDTGTDDPSLSKDWKRLQVVSVATDPAFPDPRVTPPPTPTPRPTPPPPTPTPVPSPTATATAAYTSPPLPLPIASHDPSETSPPDPTSTP
jgi:hypothetical protein